MNKDLLIITKNFYPEFGGVETYITEFIKYFLKKRNSRLFILDPKKKAKLPLTLITNRVTLCTPKFSIDFINLDNHPFGFLPMIQTILYYSFIFLKGAGMLFKKNIACIYGIGGHFSIIPTMILAKIFHKKCFGHIHADFQFIQRSSLSKIFHRWLFNSLDRIFVNSIDVEIDLLKIGILKSKIMIIDNWADSQIFKLKDKNTCRQKLSFSEDKKVLLFVGRLSYEKGINEVLDCVDLLNRDKRFLFIIIGDGPLRSKVEQRIKKNDNAIFIGPKRDIELVDYYNAADALLWGSIDTHYFSITIMEALHCGLPILAPRSTTNVHKWGIKEHEVKEEIMPDFLGRLFKSNTKGLSEAIERFMNLSFDRFKINRYATTRYSDKNAMPILEELYSKI